MKMRNSRLLMVILVAILLPGCKGREIKSQWAVQKISADGVSSDWGNAPLNYNDALDGSLSVCNDAEYLYLLLKIRDSKLLTTISHSGLRLWFDSDLKKEKNRGLIYHSRELAKYVRDTRNNPQMSPDSLPRPPRDFAPFNAWELVLLDRPDDKDDYSRTDGSKIVEAALGKEGDLFLYEFCVPLTLGPSHAWALGTHAGETVDLGIQIGMDRRSGSGGAERSGRGMGPPGGGFGPGGGEGRGWPGGMGGMGGRTGHRGPRPGGGPSSFQGDQKVEVWMKVKLAEALADST